MLNIVHCLRHILYTRRFGSWLYSRLQATGCHYTDNFFVLLVTTVGIEPVTFRTQASSGLVVRILEVY
jgi:hypothetical protein